jgi:tetratricopeptide (TPR) repeat protein
MKKAQQALELFSESWRLLKVAGKPELAMEARNGQGFAYLDMGNFREAARIFADVVEWGEARGLSALVASGYLGLGVALDSLSEFEQALSNYQAALQWLRRGGSKGNLALEPDILYLKGRIHRRLSQYEEAIEHFRAAAVRYRETKQAEGEGEALTQLAEVSL